jgi:hypothetical protein
MAVPFLALGLIYLLTGVAHTVQEPDLGDPGTLSPTGTGPDGSSRLAELLTAKGITIRRVASSAEALSALRAGGAGQRSTVFVPAPDFVSPSFFPSMSQQLGGHRLVLVRPGVFTALDLGFASGPARWAARVVSPRCAADFAIAAGPAAVQQSRYGADPTDVEIDCYDGGLVGFTSGESEILAVGATDPFRNHRIGEVGNAALATALLSRGRDVIWVDIHKAERRPSQPRGSLPRYQQPDRGAGGDNPLWAALPPVLWASFVLLFAVAVLIALAKGRRLGPPVVEPLPVVVPATETVTGQGRLYARIRARQTSLETLRAAALRRITPVINPSGGVAPVRAGRDDAPSDELIAHVAARTGIPPQQVRAILHGSAPETDEELGFAVAHLDTLVDAVLRVGQQPVDAERSVNTGGKL